MWDGVRTSYLERLHELKNPTLLVHGEQDTSVPVTQAVRAHELIAGSELRLIPECGHWVPREKPEELSRLVLDHLGRQRS
jgi:pimeloyl-ACP methyl ester carboxylesterase